jgi:hypothetical protein
MTAPGYLWFLWPALGWGVGIAFHAINVYGIGKEWGLIILIKAVKLFIFDAEWEREMIERELRKEKKTIKY